jgi:hypothetical protein
MRGGVTNIILIRQQIHLKMRLHILPLVMIIPKLRHRLLTRIHRISRRRQRIPILLRPRGHHLRHRRRPIPPLIIIERIRIIVEPQDQASDIIRIIIVECDAFGLRFLERNPRLSLVYEDSKGKSLLTLNVLSFNFLKNADRWILFACTAQVYLSIVILKFGGFVRRP